MDLIVVAEEIQALIAELNNCLLKVDNNLYELDWN